MGFNLTGYVLRPARLASGNSSSTGEALSGVSRDHIEGGALANLGYIVLPTDPVEPYADMYRAAVLLKPEGRSGTEEYVVWAANSGSFSTVESDSFTLAGDPSFVTPSAGSLAVVGGYTDGTDTLFVRDEGGRSISSVISLFVARGDTGAPVACVFASQDPLTGRVVLDAATLANLGGGFSEERGDSTISVWYVLSSPTFWWSRNDSNATRFGWDGKRGRWAPFQGSTPQNLGEVSVDPDETYKLSPPPSRFSVGDQLPGDNTSPDAFSLVRVGLYADAFATPLDVLVVSDEDVAAGSYLPAWAAYDAVVGAERGILFLNPTFADANAGITLWYSPESFKPNNTGDLGSLGDLPTDSTLGSPILSPIPGPTERPFIRLGFRRYLTPIPVDDDASLPLPTGVTEGSFYWSRSTGKIVLSEDDIKKAQPGELEYDIAYLEAHVFYDGVALSSQPVPLQEPAPCVNASGNDLIGVDAGGVGIPLAGDLFIKKAVPMPPPGASGVLYVPDGTGTTPNTATVPETRPNGSGIVRTLQGLGDTFIFTSSKALETLTVEEYEEDIPVLKIKVAKTEAATSKLASASQPAGYADTSRVQMKRRGIVGDALYFIQTQVTPSVYSEEARLYARFGESYVLEGTELLRFAVDGFIYTWDASVNYPNGGTLTAQQMAADIDVVITGTGAAGVIRGRVYIEAGDLAAGSVEIGWNTDQTDLSGHAALGFLPGWRVETPDGIFCWQPDNGASIGLYRSPENLDRSHDAADIKATAFFDSETLTTDIPGIPFFTVINPPLEDLPGYDEGVHFLTAIGLNIVRLSNYGVTQGVGLKYDWTNDRLIWTEEGEVHSTLVPAETNTLQLDDTNIFQETVSSEAMVPTGSDFGLYLKDAGSTTLNELILSEDFTMPGDGAAGQAVLISPEGGAATSGGGGFFNNGGVLFTNPNLSPDPAQDALLQVTLLNNVGVGYLLEILGGDAQGVYTIINKALIGNVATFTVSPEFPVDGVGTSWQILEHQTLDVYDPTVVADIQLVPFNHFPEEPFSIRVLSALGAVGSGVLVAAVADALASDREVWFRFDLGIDPANETDISYLDKGVDLGVLSSEGNALTDVTDQHFTDSGATSYFQIRIGAEVFSTFLGNLSMVAAFSPVIAVGEIEVGDAGSPIEGQIQCAADVLSDHESEHLTYDQLFLDPVNLSAGFSEVDPSTGEVNLSSADIATYTGEELYFVEQMVTEGKLDATISPINGSILFNKPLREFQIVEAAYYQADTDGDQVLDANSNPTLIQEYLPLTVRLEETTRVTDSEFTYNPTGRTLDPGGEFVWAGVNLQNFAGLAECTFDDGDITFNSDVAIGDAVKINYAVLEAFGGEQAFTVSKTPVYRKPFFLAAEQDEGVFEGDRTSDVTVGKLALVGTTPFYIKAVSYNAVADETSVTFWPSPLTEVGSRAPGRDAGFSLTNTSVAITVDPDNPVAGGGNEGFLPIAAISILPADKGQLEFTAIGDFTAFAKVGHLLEVGGYPYIIVDSALSEDGRFTAVSVANPLYKGYDGSDEIRVSVRPVYGPNPVAFEGVAPFLDTEDFSLYLLGVIDALGNELPGRKLVEGTHYNADSATGNVLFLSPIQLPLNPWETLVASFTALQSVVPIAVEDAILYPVFEAKYLFITTPSLANRLLASTLQARYTYRSPDTFYYETLPLEDYMAEVADVALSNAASSTQTGGASNAFPGTVDNSKQGVLGLRSQVQDYKDRDRAARSFIELYNGTILAFEQVLEAIDGRVIGDRDGKFRFFIGHDKQYAPPGYQDGITGDLEERLIWREIVDTWSDPALLAGGFYVETDPVYDPETAEEKDPANRPGETDGTTPNPKLLSDYIQRQRERVKNDMDDRLLVGFGRPRMLAAIFPSINVPGLFKDMWENHPYSRLFPERTKHFSRLFPGLEAVLGAEGFTDAGYYSPGRKVEYPGPEPGETTKQIVSTRGDPIGKVANPALGEIEGIVEVEAHTRYPRARIWRYFPEGDADLDAVLPLGSTPTVGTATFVATPLPLGEFPIDPDTGFPDYTQLLSEGGDLYDLITGDPDLSTPGFEPGQMLQFGTPEGAKGTEYDLTDSDENGIFVGLVQAGCVITLADVDGVAISGSDVLVLNSTPLGDLVSEGTGRGDSVYARSPMPDIVDIPISSDPLTQDTMELLVPALEQYRIQFDLGVAKRTGEFVDHTLNTSDDAFPLPLQGILGQRPPEPLACIEGMVEFVNTNVAPLELPALKGEAADDSGDVQVPYMKGSDTELSVLGEVAAEFQVLLGSDSTVGIPYTPSVWTLLPNEIQLWQAIYPDEVVVDDGEIYETYSLAPDRNPATLYTDRDMTPVATAGLYTADSAIGDVRPFDLILVETMQPQQVAGELNTGMTGILTVGDVSGFAAHPTFSTLEPPRFVTPVERDGVDVHRYTIEGAYGYLSGVFPAVSGLLVLDAPGFTLSLDASSVGGVHFDDGNPGLAGGLLPLVVGGNPVVIRFYDPDPGAAPGAAFLGAIVIPALTPPGVVYAYDPAGGSAVFALNAGGVYLSGTDILNIDTVADILAHLTSVLNAFYYDFTIDIDTYISANTALYMGNPGLEGSGVGSTTCSIDRDRLTFNERVSFATTLPRDSNPANGDIDELGIQFEMWRCTVSGIADNTVNSVVETNGGNPFTLLERLGPDPDATVPVGAPYVGTFVPATVSGAGDENGKLRMMAWEGFGNSTLPFTVSPVTSILLSAVPSSDLGETAAILEDTGLMRDDTQAGFTTNGTFDWIEQVAGGASAVAGVQSGDIVVIDGSNTTDKGAVAAGTYLVRHAVDTNTASSTGVQLEEAVLYSDAGVNNAFDMRFPTVSSITGLALVLEGVPLAPYAPENCGFPTGDGATTFVYLILKRQYAAYDAGTTTYTLDADCVYRMAYNTVTYNPATQEATFDLATGTAVDALGAPLANDDAFTDEARRGVEVSGMLYLPFNPREASGFPSNNVVGWLQDPAATALTAGFLRAIAGNRNLSNHGGTGGTVPTTTVWDKLAGPANIERLLGPASIVAAPGNLGVRVPVPNNSTAFYVNRASVIYGRMYSGVPQTDPIAGVAAHVSTELLGLADWNNIHFDNTATNAATAAPIVGGDHVLYCLLPGDRLLAGDDLELSTPPNPGFFGLSGVFLEPSFPRPVTDLALATPHVVSDAYTLGAVNQRGHRNYSAFDMSGGFPIETEGVHFYIRRIRRFHEVQADIASNLELLKYVYEMRKGEFNSYNINSRVFTADTVTYGTATNLGDFDDPDVNVNAGDMLRILDADGNLIDQAEIQRVDGADTVRLQRPGLTQNLASAALFEVYLRQPIVPHEQSNEQLLSWVTDEEVFRRVVEYTGAPTGGAVSTFNQMQDTTAGFTSWADLGVHEGDYVLVDPAGELFEITEFGVRPFGDVSVAGRAPYDDSEPNPLDDNRGFYKVTGGLAGSDLEVDGSSRFGGGSPNGTDNEVFGDAGAEYAVLPTVSDSTLTGAAEGQQALRPTAAAVGTSFLARGGADAFRSIQPFGYRIIRPSPIFSEDALELVLFVRERMLSWIEEVQSIYRNGRGGDYWVFQDEDHIDDVGSPVDPADGAGLVSNLVIESLEGLVGETPFANTSDCLSVLDRRFWILDSRLDIDGYTDFVDDGFGQRPVLPDLIEDVLDLDDRFRALRYSWIRFRADRQQGSIKQAKDAEDQLPDELQKQKELVDQRRALDET
jgi:hypothetical protein